MPVSTKPEITFYKNMLQLHGFLWYSRPERFDKNFFCYLIRRGGVPSGAAAFIENEGIKIGK